MSEARQPAGDLRAADSGRKVLLKGWIGRRRDLGDLIFLTVRDRSGTVQVLFDRARCPPDAVSSASQARSEDVVEIEGEVVARVAGQVNRDQPTGEIEVVASRLEFLARSDTPPFQIEDRTNAAEDLRLEYRYLDLRRPATTGGTGMIYERMAHRVQELGGDVHLRHRSGASFTKTAMCRPGTGRRPLRAVRSSDLDHAVNLARRAWAICRRRSKTELSAAFPQHDPRVSQRRQPRSVPGQWLYVHSPELGTGRVTNFRNWVPELYGDSPQQHPRPGILVLRRGLPLDGRRRRVDRTRRSARCARPD